MKSEDLLTGLSEVGEDLLAETESGIRVSTRRPWVGGAIAAGLALLIGLGGLTFWQVRKHRREAAAEAATVIMPGPEAEALEQFYVDRNWRGESAWTFDNLERSLRVNRWTLETGADRLPVYEVPTTHPDMEGWTWEGGMEQSLRGILNEAAARLGLPAPEDVRIQEEGGEIAWVEADTEMGVLTVYLNGTVRILLNEEHWLTATVKLDFAEELSVWERDAEYRDAVMEACGEQVEALLGLPACHPAVCDRYSSLSSNYTAYILYPVREDPAEQLKSRSFETVRLLTVGGKSVMGLEWDRLPEAGGTCTVPEDWRCMGNYPIISAEEAKQAVLQGAYYIDTRTNAVPPPVAEENLAWGELVYLPDAEDVGVLLPFYRFWVPCREGEVTSLMDCAAVYVPAVDPDYLIDYPEEAPVDTREDILSLRDCFFGNGTPLSEDRIFRDIDSELDLSPWSDRDPERAQYLNGYPEEWQQAVPEIQLPVFRNKLQSEAANGLRALTQEEMERIARGQAERLGTEILSTESTEGETADGSHLTVETGLGQLQIFRNGDYAWSFNSPIAIPETAKAAFPTGPVTDENHGDYMLAWINALADPDDEPPHVLPGCSVYYDEAGNAEKRFYLWVNEPYPHEGILGYSFSRVTMELDESGRLLALRSARQDEEGRKLGYDDSRHDLLPDYDNARLYPWIPKDMADASFRSGFYITTVSPSFFPGGEVSGQALLEHAVHCEIVYRLDGATLFMPFYRYWVELDSGDLAEGLTRYGAFYVPAIPIDNLTDYPLALMPGMRSSGTPEPDPGIEETEYPDGQDPAALPVLSLANCFGNNGEEGKLFRDPNNEIALSPISDFTMDLPKELPVYQNMAYVDESGIPVYLVREEMQLRADALVQRWKLQVQREEWIDGALRPEDPAGTEPRPSALIVETDKATVTVYGNGECLVTFRESLDKDTELAAEWVFDPAAPLTSESAAAYAKAWAEYCEGCDGIQVQCEPVYGYADMEARTYTCVYYLTEPARDDEAARLEQRLLEYTFHEQLYMDENGNLTGYRTHLVPPSAVSSCYAAEAVGTYPILSKAEADQALKNGFFFTNASMPVFRNGKPLGEALLAHTVAAELVYRTGNDRYFLPYYRYWVVGDVRETAGGLTQCGAVYVPAIPEEYLTDWPEYLMPGWFGDDELAALQALFEDENSWYGRILRCGAFPAPDLVPLGNLLCAGLPGVDNTLSDEERAELEAAATAEQLDTGVEPVKLPKQTLNDLLQSALGLTLDQIQYNDLRDWVYLEDRDCFYLFGEDPGGIIIEVESYIELSDSELQLRYWRLEDGRDTPVMYVANLRKTGDGYLVLSNEPAEWNN